MKKIISIAITLVGAMASAESVTNWSKSGSCYEYTPSGATIRGLSLDDCREIRGSMYHWTASGTCAEYTPSGALIAQVDTNICRGQTGVIVKLGSSGTATNGKPAAAKQCAFQDDAYMFSLTHVVSQKRQFKDSSGASALEICRASGFANCVQVSEGRTESHGQSEVLETLNMLNPLSVITGLGFSSERTVYIKGVANGYNYKMKSESKMRKDICPQLKVCSLNASADELATMKQISEQLACN